MLVASTTKSTQSPNVFLDFLRGFTIYLGHGISAPSVGLGESGIEPDFLVLRLFRARPAAPVTAASRKEAAVAV